MAPPKKPARADAKVAPGARRREGANLRIIDAQKTVGLHDRVPDAPSVGHQLQALRRVGDAQRAETKEQAGAAMKHVRRHW